MGALLLNQQQLLAATSLAFIFFGHADTRDLQVVDSAGDAAAVEPAGAELAPGDGEANGTASNATEVAEQQTNTTKHDGETVVMADGDPWGMLGQGCRVLLAQMFANSADCTDESLSVKCSASIISVSEWRLFCLSGLFSASAIEVFRPDDPGDLKAVWGPASTSYLQQLGRVGASLNATTANENQSTVYAAAKASAVLGPVLQAVTQCQEESCLAKAVLLTWTMSLSQIPTPLPRELMSRLVLGSLALETLQLKFTLDSSLDDPPPFPANATSSSDATAQGEGRTLQGIPVVDSPLTPGFYGGAWLPGAYLSSDTFSGLQEDSTSASGTPPHQHGRNLQAQGSGLQFLRLPFDAMPNLGAGYRRDFSSIFRASVPDWFPSWPVNVPLSDVRVDETQSGVACGSRDIGRLLQSFGVGAYTGNGSAVPAAASFITPVDSRTVCAAALLKRAFDTGVELSSIDPDALPTLTPAAKQLLATGGRERI